MIVAALNVVSNRNVVHAALSLVAVMADHAAAWVRDGARIVGGCCGTRPEHIRAIRDRLATGDAPAPA